MVTETRKATNLSLEAQLLVEARQLDVNLSRAAEQGIRDAVSAAKAERWKRENAPAIKAFNQWAENNEWPLREFRSF
jgi:antitoxin CcdA